METTQNCASTSAEHVIALYFDDPQDGNNGENGGQGRLFEWEGKKYFEANTDDDPQPLKDWFTGAATAAGETGCSFEGLAPGSGAA